MTDPRDDAKNLLKQFHENLQLAYLAGSLDTITWFMEHIVQADVPEKLWKNSVISKQLKDITLESTVNLIVEQMRGRDDDSTN